MGVGAGATEGRDKGFGEVGAGVLLEVDACTGVMVGVGDGVDAAIGVGAGLGVGLGVGMGAGVGVATVVGIGGGVAVGVGVAVGMGVGVGGGVALTVNSEEPPTDCSTLSESLRSPAKEYAPCWADVVTE